MTLGEHASLGIDEFFCLGCPAAYGVPGPGVGSQTAVGIYAAAGPTPYPARGLLRRPGSMHFPIGEGCGIGECTITETASLSFFQGAGLFQLYWQQWLIL